MMGFRPSVLWLKDAAILAASLLLMAAVGLGFSHIMERGQVPGKNFIDKTIQSFLDSIETSIRAGSGIRNDWEIRHLVTVLQNRLGTGLAEVEPDVKISDIRILVVESDAINALALPGNLIILFTGLIRHMDNPENLASVLAHEIGHCVNNDSRNALLRDLGVSLLAGVTGMGNVDRVTERLVRGAVRLNYGRKAEKKADHFAVDLLVASRIDPFSFADALRSLENLSNAPEWFQYIDDHPRMEKRIRDAQRRGEMASLYQKDFTPIAIDWLAIQEALDYLE